MIIIADGGSTKTNWCLLNEHGKKIYFNTEGYNPFFVTREYIIGSLKKGLPEDLDIKNITEVYYYGAGVHSDEKASLLSGALKTVFTSSEIFVGHDLLAAARALLGKDAGFAAILGTGTNSCLYDGDEITHQINSGAYILGDEGSGCHIGKKLLVDYLRGYMPEAVRRNFWETYKLTEEEIEENVYSKPLASRFCAGFSKFVYDNTTNIEYTRGIVKSSFNDFFKNLVSHYPGYRNYTFNCVGSVAYNFRNVIGEVASEWEMEMGLLLRSPIDNLVKFHELKANS